MDFRLVTPLTARLHQRQDVHRFSKPFLDSGERRKEVHINRQKIYSIKFSKIIMALNPMRRIFLKTLLKVASYSAYQNLIKFEIYTFIAKTQRVLLAGETVARVTYSVTKTLQTCSSMIGAFLIT